MMREIPIPSWPASPPAAGSWALAHFSRFIRRRAQGFDSTSSGPDLDHMAVQNPDGSKALVITNRGASKTEVVQIAGMVAEVAIKEDSMATLGWA
jgi:O-glycosyl hydrolase